MSKKTPTMRLLELRYKKPIDELLIEKYNQHGSLEAMATEFDVHFTTLHYWMARRGISLKRKPTLSPDILPEPIAQQKPG